ncbi:uncharacterized protein LOC126475402 [Schistocerca serialis cubense]|uniref:uncharacterized protein LOC126475402 n=1 Tax=Schistocerca serialis cubense TaxID=2023355 RepID=UPI00214E1445|nr:uncharacterized protein LOC126475402 [Schistocerca serialis cubense]
MRFETKIECNIVRETEVKFLCYTWRLYSDRDSSRLTRISFATTMSRDFTSGRQRELPTDKREAREALYYATSAVMADIPVLMEEMADSVNAVNRKMYAVNELLRAVSQHYVQPNGSQNTKP